MIFIKKMMVGMFLMFALNLHAHNKIVILLSPPRSLSVAFFRMMDARGDFKVMHEPFICPFDRIHFPEETKDWFCDGAADTYEKVKYNIFEYSKTSNVFIKEMPFSFKDFILNDPDFVENPHVYFIFLVRNPHHSVISMYWKMKGVFDDVMISRNLVRFSSYEDFYFIFDYAVAHNTNTPLVLRTENLYNNPEATIMKLCNHLDIPYIAKSLSWNSLGDDFDLHAHWDESKQKQFIDHWHGDALTSTGFGKPRDYEVDENGNPTFSEIPHGVHKDVCRVAYETNKIYYDRLFAEYQEVVV